MSFSVNPTVKTSSNDLPLRIGKMVICDTEAQVIARYWINELVELYRYRRSWGAIRVERQQGLRPLVRIVKLLEADLLDVADILELLDQVMREKNLASIGGDAASRPWEVGGGPHLGNALRGETRNPSVEGSCCRGAASRGGGQQRK